MNKIQKLREVEVEWESASSANTPYHPTIYYSMSFHMITLIIRIPRRVNCDSASRMKRLAMKPMSRIITNARIAFEVFKNICKHIEYDLLFNIIPYMMIWIRLPSRVNCACLGIGSSSFHWTGKQSGSYSRYWGNTWREMSVGVAAILRIYRMYEFSH
jgi:hypothetical protein